MGEQDTDEENNLQLPGIRSMLLNSYDVPKHFYGTGFEGGKNRMRSVARRLADMGILLYYGDLYPTRKKRTKMNVDEMVERWHKAVVGLAMAHTKDDADRWEASIESCLTPILVAPIAQVREFAPKLLTSLKSDPTVPFLVWRSYEVWTRLMEKAPDEEIKVLKTDLAKQIVDMIEPDVREQLPEALIRALQWRSPEKLEEVKTVVEKEQAAGKKVRLKGRESCLFVEAGGTDENPEVCIQV